MQSTECVNELVIMPTHCIYYGLPLPVTLLNRQPAAARLLIIIILYCTHFSN